MDTQALQALRDEVASRRRQLDRQAGEARAVAEDGKRVAGELNDANQRVQLLEEAIGVMNSIADTRQADIQNKIETLVTHGLRTIFSDDMSFHITPGKRGNIAAADLTIRTLVDGQPVETGILDARGGGVAAVAGFLLRLIIVLLSGSRTDPVLVMDETFAQLSEEYEPRLAEFLRELVDKTRVQIILVTHSNAFTDHADNAYRFELDQDGRTVVSNA